jgi:hypothetical protein
MFLPLNHDYPFELHESDYIHFLVDVNKLGFLKITLKKWDLS